MYKIGRLRTFPYTLYIKENTFTNMGIGVVIRSTILAKVNCLNTIYTLPKSAIKTLSKNPKKGVDKRYDYCYNNQAVSRGGSHTDSR